MSMRKSMNCFVPCVTLSFLQSCVVHTVPVAACQRSNRAHRLGMDSVVDINFCMSVDLLVQAHSPVCRCFRALWRGKVAALAFVLVTQACGIKLAFAMCLLQCLHCTDEAHIGRNRGSPVCSLSIDLECHFCLSRLKSFIISSFHAYMFTCTVSGMMHSTYNVVCFRKPFLTNQRSPASHFQV